MVNLVIVESPAKCQKIKGFLGPGWEVIATMGHIRSLDEKLDAIGLYRDFEPTYQFIKEKAKTMTQLKDAAKGATIYLASDDDREGEAISYAVCVLLKLNVKTTRRAVFHEITEKAVKHAVENYRYLDMNRVNAQQSRAMLDMMIGFTISPLLWKYVAPSLSAGRCQTPALRLIVDREDKINNFKTSSSWRLQANWIHSEIKDFECKGQMDDELEDEESAINYMEMIYQTLEATIISKHIRPWTEKAPDPLITSTLQQQASALFGINPKNTMKIAQRLYEAGHITYMRTDKAVLSEDATKDAKDWVLQNYGNEYVDQKEKKEEKKEGAQEAHEAIRPTHMEVTSIEDEYDKKIYKLIWQRTIQSVMAPAKGEICSVSIQIDDENTWSSQWKHTTFEGWKKVGKIANLDEENEVDDVDDIWNKAITLNVGDKVTWSDIKAEPKETKAQGRYTEAMLVRELEKNGIGRPSTFASLIAVIQDKNYVITNNIPAKEVTVKEYIIKPNVLPEGKDIKKKVGAEKNKLVPTELGRSVLAFVVKNFDDLFNYKFTSQMEKRLDKVAEGEDWKQVLRDMWNSYKDRYETLTKEKGTDRVKEFNGIKAIQSKKGPLLLIEGIEGVDTQFIGWPSGIAFEDMTEEIALQFKETNSNEIGEWNGKKIIKKTGKFGEYLQCDNVSIPYQEEEFEKTIERFNAKNDVKNSAKQFKEYVIRTGKYGPYIMKTTLKKPQFVSLPKGINVNTLTEKEVESIYKLGLESKKYQHK